MTKPARVILASLIALALLSLCMVVVQAHSFYDGWCCQNSDCAPIPSKAVRAIPGGVQITLGPGDHPLVTRVHVFQIPQSEIRKSQDDNWHVCLFPSEDHLRCVYMPPMGM